ncbi:metal-dependent hydrolase [Peristeroidobacter agariperforans]|uniref:metal-dependent hydrolase n=1 Tax=Peristeroidobacter agariperforans TaxID=268404 RepID=UPI00101DB734|nr:metal-dependent hydrolase [Peristeroidobacter agariperforans]
MDTPVTGTPADLTITPRDLRLDRNALSARWWHGGDPVATAYFNALSVSFPQGETFFIESVRRFRDWVDGRLQEQIKAFVEQEAAHTREHVVFNKLIKSAGYDTTTMDAETRRRLDIARSRHPVAQLAITVALEHFTAIMAHSLLTEKDPLPGAPAEVLRLWQWHAIEEVEHKAVAFDTYLAVTRELSAFKRWSIRCQVMLFISAQFWYSNFQRMADFFRQDGINTPRTWWRVFTYLSFKPGMMRKVLVPYLSFFRPGFHPWDHDDGALVREFEQRLRLAEPAAR